MSEKKVRWGIIGCAGIAKSALIPGLLLANNAILHAIASRDQKKLGEFVAQFSPVRTFVGYDELLQDPELDAVYIPLPNHLHLEWVCKAAAAGKHILCEKPLGLNVAEVAKMHEVCRNAGVILMEAFAYRHSPVTIKVKELVDTGAIGDLRCIEAAFSFMLNDPNNIRMVKSMGGGATYDVGCYTLDVIRYLVGQQALTVQATGQIDPVNGTDRSSSVHLRYPGNIDAWSWCSFDATYRNEYTVLGTKGIIRVNEAFNAKGKQTIQLSQEGLRQDIIIDTPDNYMLEIEQMGRCILNGERPWVSPQSSISTMQLIDEVLQQIQYR